MENSLDQKWQSWVDENIQRNCDPEEILAILLKNGFPLRSISKAMGDKYPRKPSNPANAQPQNTVRATFKSDNPLITAGVDHKALCEIPLMCLARQKNIERINLPNLQLLKIDRFLSDKECDRLVEISNPNLRRSTVTYGPEDYRTSSTCDLSLLKNPFVESIDKKIAVALGIQLPFSEGIQAQKYLVGEQFKSHTDFFEPGTDEFRQHASMLGNRTWTFMIYLNNTIKGGGTRFTKIDKIFYPKKGTAVIWNNLHADGTPNRDTEHWGMPIEEGEKVIITKWFRELGSGEMFYGNPF